MLPATKKVLAIPPRATTRSDEARTGSVDCLGYDYAVIDVMVGDSVASNTNAYTTLTVTECTQASTTGTVAITGCVQNTDYTAPAVASNATTVMASFGIDLRGRKRYLIVALTQATDAGTTANCVLATLYRGEEGAITTTKQGTKLTVTA